MNPANKIGLLVDSLKKSTSLVTKGATNYVRTKKNNFLAKPVVSLVDSRLRYMVSAENIDNMKIKYDNSYHWIAGTEVTEVQERARYLESKLNRNRKEMREAREQLDNVTERQREIASELENTGRGDLRHLHLRQLEYDNIQEEFKLSKIVQTKEFQERETFTLLMNTVRESHETERNYNQRIKMISLIGAVLGPFVGYLFSARLNAMRFKRMEEIINKKLELLSFSTVNAVREIHGLDPEVMSEPEKRGLITKILETYSYLQSKLLEAYQMAVTASSGTLEYIQEQLADEEIKEKIAELSVSSKDVSVQTTPEPPTSSPTPAVPEVIKETVVVEKHFPREVNYSELPEFKALMRTLRTIEEKQDSLKHLFITSQELLDANKIEVSVNTSDEEIVSMLQADQQVVRKILLSVEDLLRDSRTSLTSSLCSLMANIESLSMKITNNSELYVGGLEHSKIVNDMAKSLVDIKGSIDMIETYYINDGSKSLTELSGVRSDLDSTVSKVSEDLHLQNQTLEQIIQTLDVSNSNQSELSSQVTAMLNSLGDILQGAKDTSSVDELLTNVELVTTNLSNVKDLISEFQFNQNKEYNDQNEKVVLHLQKFDESFKVLEDKMLAAQKLNHDNLMDKMEDLKVPAVPSVVEKSTDTEEEGTEEGVIVTEEEGNEDSGPPTSAGIESSEISPEDEVELETEFKSTMYLYSVLVVLSTIIAAFFK